MGILEKLFGTRSTLSTGASSPDRPSGGAPEEIAGGELQRRLTLSAPPVLLDVREARELRAHGSIPGRLHIPTGHVPMRLGELDPARPIVVYCAHGVRSYKVAAFLLDNGFQTVASLRGGFARWKGEVQRGG